jgi:hypothetical protein
MGIPEGFGALRKSTDGGVGYHDVNLSRGPIEYEHRVVDRITILTNN